MLFVYGTLMPGHVRWPLVESYVHGHEPATVAGRLFDTGHGFPAATFGGDDVIEGHVLRFDDDRAEEAWQVVDAIEGTLYDRVPVTTLAGLAVESYAWAGSTEGLTPIGRWTGA